jgi:hypothetical protein
MDETPVRAPLLPNVPVVDTPVVEPVKADQTVTSSTVVEVPYLDYQRANSRPWTVDHFQLGDTWQDPIGGFPQEIKTIEDYLAEKVDSGELANSVSAIGAKLKEMEKMINLKGEERVAVKLPTLAAHIEFLTKTDGIKRSLNRYGQR